jgi:hypothetical protein
MLLHLPSVINRRLRLLPGVVALAAAAVLSRPAQAQDPTALFNQAVAAYQRGHFDSATAGFLRLAQGGIDDDRVWYNLGNSYFKSGRIGSALVAYRRGLRLAPRDPDLIANYRYVRLFAADKIESAGTFFLERWWRGLVDRISLAESRLLAGLAFWLAALLTAYRWWLGMSANHGRLAMVRRPSVPLWVIGGVWVVWLILTGGTATCYSRDVTSRPGAVVAVQADVRGGPGDDYALQFIAHDGLEGTVERSEAGWHLVRFPNGLKGWVVTSAFEPI